MKSPTSWSLLVGQLEEYPHTPLVEQPRSISSTFAFQVARRSSSPTRREGLKSCRRTVEHSRHSREQYKQAEEAVVEKKPDETKQQERKRRIQAARRVELSPHHAQDDLLHTTRSGDPQVSYKATHQ